MTIRIRFGRDFGEHQVSPGTTLLAAATRAKAPLGNACRAQGICQACAVQIISGAELLEPPSDLEQRMQLAPDWRMACQTRVRGHGYLKLWTPNWGGEP